MEKEIFFLIHVTVAQQKYKNQLLNHLVNASYIDNKSADSDPLLQHPPPNFPTLEII